MFLNADCMNPETGLPSYPDKFFDLAIVDPPYGINMSNYNRYSKNLKFDMTKTWDDSIPSAEYFDELFRVSKKQIIWGGNYFTNFLPPSKGWIFWNKKQQGNLQVGELAWTNGDKMMYVERRWQLDSNLVETKIHPTQKPIKLYQWLLENYATEGNLILDTHVGSASSLIACESMGFRYVGFELDADYYEAAKKRMQSIQVRMF